MKTTVVLALALAIGLSACAKKKIAPGAPFEHNHESDVHKPAEKSAYIAKDPNNLLVGSWMASCEDVLIDAEENEIVSYAKFKDIKSDGTMVEKEIEFEGAGCNESAQQWEIGTRTWLISVTEKGELDNQDKPFIVDLSLNGSDAQVVRFDLKSSPETLVIREDGEVFKRLQ